MERFVGAGFLLLFGIGLALYASRALAAGEVRAGANFLQGPFVPTRDERPALFYGFALVYLLGGAALTFWGVLMLFGLAGPIAWR